MEQNPTEIERWNLEAMYLNFNICCSGFHLYCQPWSFPFPIKKIWNKVYFPLEKPELKSQSKNGAITINKRFNYPLEGKGTLRVSGEWERSRLSSEPSIGKSKGDDNRMEYQTRRVEESVTKMIPIWTHGIRVIHLWLFTHWTPNTYSEYKCVN